MQTWPYVVPVDVPPPPLHYQMQNPMQNPEIKGQYEPNPEMKWRRRVNLISYVILYMLAIAVVVIYGIILSKFITPHLDLFETGNWWTFILLFGSCGVVIIGGIRPLQLHWKNFPLRYTHVIWYDLLIIVCWIGLFFVAMGASETFQDRKKCQESTRKCTQKWAPSSPTHFGLYIMKVCNNGSEFPIDDKVPNEGPNSTDLVKCKASRDLQIAILCMYVWTLMMLICQCVDTTIGLGNYRRRDEPEVVFVRDKNPGNATAWGKT